MLPVRGEKLDLATHTPLTNQRGFNQELQSYPNCKSSVSQGELRKGLQSFTIPCVGS